MPSQRCKVFNCHNGGPFSKVRNTRKANVHEVRGSRTTKVEQGSKDAVNFPRDDSAHSLFLGKFSAEQPKGKTTVEQPGRSKVITRFSSQQIHFTNTPQPQSGRSTDYKKIFPHPTARRLGPTQLLTTYGGHQIKLWARQLSIICTPQWQYQEGNLRCDRCCGPSNTWVKDVRRT